MMTLAGYSIMKLFMKDNDKKLIWMTVCFILIYPLYKIASAGWGGGTIVYTWSLGTLLFACIPIKKIFCDEKIKKYMYPLYSLALIYACNQEQTCVVAFGIYFVFTILAILKNKKKTNVFMFVQDLIVILSLIFIATCPGNYARKIDEIAMYYPDFATYGLFDKVSLGITATMNSLLINGSVVVIVFSILTSTYIMKMYKNKLYSIIALIPAVAVLVFGVFKEATCKMFPYFGMFCDMMSKNQAMVNIENYTNLLNFFPIILDFIVLGSMALSLLLIFKKMRKNVAILIFILGLATRVAMGFSPTVFASTERTFIFFEFAILLDCILVWKEYLKETDKAQVKVRDRLEVFFVIVAILQYLHTLIFTFISQV